MTRKNNLDSRIQQWNEMPGTMIDNRDKRVSSTKTADHNPGNSCYRRPGSQKK